MAPGELPSPSTSRPPIQGFSLFSEFLEPRGFPGPRFPSFGERALDQLLGPGTAQVLQLLVKLGQRGPAGCMALKQESHLRGRSADTWREYQEAGAQGGHGGLGFTSLDHLRVLVFLPLYLSSFPQSQTHPRISDYHMSYITRHLERKREATTDGPAPDCLSHSFRGDVHPFIHSLTQLLLIQHLLGTITLDRLIDRQIGR